MTEAPQLPTYDAALHLVFDTEAEAITAEAQISIDMGFNGSITARWDIPCECDDGRWIFAKPPVVELPE